MLFPRLVPFQKRLAGIAGPMEAPQGDYSVLDICSSWISVKLGSRSPAYGEVWWSWTVDCFCVPRAAGEGEELNCFRNMKLRMLNMFEPLTHFMPWLQSTETCGRTHGSWHTNQRDLAEHLRSLPWGSESEACSHHRDGGRGANVENRINWIIHEQLFFQELAANRQATEHAVGSSRWRVCVPIWTDEWMMWVNWKG